MWHFKVHWTNRIIKDMSNGAPWVRCIEITPLPYCYCRGFVWCRRAKLFHLRQWWHFCPLVQCQGQARCQKMAVSNGGYFWSFHCYLVVILKEEAKVVVYDIELEQNSNDKEKGKKQQHVVICHGKTVPFPKALLSSSRYCIIAEFIFLSFLRETLIFAITTNFLSEVAQWKMTLFQGVSRKSRQGRFSSFSTAQSSASFRPLCRHHRSTSSGRKSC